MEEDAEEYTFTLKRLSSTLYKRYRSLQKQSNITIAQFRKELQYYITEAKKLLGDIYNAQKDFEQAIMMYKRSLETDANDPNVITALGIAYVNTNRYEPARELLGEVVQTQPQNLKAWRYLGFSALQLNYIEQAIESYSSALAVDENDWQALNGLGVAYMMAALEKTDNEFRDKAILQWKLSLELKPDQQYREKLTEMIRKYSKE